MAKAQEWPDVIASVPLPSVLSVPSLLPRRGSHLDKLLCLAFPVNSYSHRHRGSNLLLFSLCLLLSRQMEATSANKTWRHCVMATGLRMEELRSALSLYEMEEPRVTCEPGTIKFLQLRTIDPFPSAINYRFQNYCFYGEVLSGVWIPTLISKATESIHSPLPQEQVTGKSPAESGQESHKPNSFLFENRGSVQTPIFLCQT